MSGTVLQHVTFSSFIDVRFWSELGSLKLDGLRLSSEPRPFWGSFATPKAASQPNTDSAAQKTATLNFGGGSLNEDEPTSGRAVRAVGKITIVNTMESFKETNYNEFLNKAGAEIAAAIENGDAVKNPTLLVRCDALVYPDLKSYKHTYWFNFPALLLKAPPTLSSPPAPLSSLLNDEQQIQLHAGYQQLIDDANGALPPFFLVSTNASSAAVSVKPLAAWEEEGATDKANTVFGFVDPSSLTDNPGWPLRNLLVLLKRRWQLGSVKVLCYRDASSTSPPSSSASLIMHIAIPEQRDSDTSAVGWEANAKGRMGARRVDLAPFMDPARRAVESADLNLKLMRWRFLPELDPDRLATVPCLLLGAGTLGCNVSRSLLSWGFRKITLVDYGKVSYSNPTRQWLFEYEDCIDPENPSEGKPKAQAAADRLKRIVPNVEATAHALSIPMPGHPVSPQQQESVLADVGRLEALIEAAELVFLLTDTRESRWLPSVICAAKNKLCMNVALGFDTFVLLRHGIPDPSQGAAADASPGDPPQCNLGCYFCNDVVAPTDSTRNRTLDQQCTATRPGLSAIASSLAVELAVTLLHHPLRSLAPADTAGQVGDTHEGAGLGLVPHQVRGFLSTFNNVLVKGDAFNKCTACSPKVLGGYLREGHSFLLQAFNEPDFLEELSGLKEFLKAADDGMDAWDDEDEPDMPED